MRSFIILTLIVSVLTEDSVNSHNEAGILPASQRKNGEKINFINSRIFGGELAELGEFPFMAGLIIHYPDGSQSVCGAALLTNTKLVTAAHCWATGSFQADKLTVVLGSTTLFTGGVRIDTDKVVIHPDYNPVNRNNDVAMVTIDPVEFNDTISPINLPFKSYSYAGSAANIAGFGTTDENTPLTRSQVLRKAHVQVITNQACSQTYGSDVVTESTLCTSGQFSNTCAGDKGSPLSIHTIDGPQLIGIASFQSNRGCDAGSPAGFVRIHSFQKWIEDQL